MSHHLLFSIIWWRKGTSCSGFLVFTGTGAGIHRELILWFPSFIKTSLIIVKIFNWSACVFHFLMFQTDSNMNMFNYYLCDSKIDSFNFRMRRFNAVLFTRHCGYPSRFLYPAPSGSPKVVGPLYSYWALKVMLKDLCCSEPSPKSVLYSHIYRKPLLHTWCQEVRLEIYKYHDKDEAISKCLI